MILAACEQAMPWLPEEAVMTSVEVSSKVNFDSAPRSLKDPVCWKFSALNQGPSACREARQGVRAMCPPIRRRAASASAATCSTAGDRVVISGLRCTDPDRGNSILYESGNKIRHSTVE